MKSIKKSFPFGQHTVTLETGEIARQADGAVLVTMDDTVVLVTCVARKEPKSGQSFFPLTVDYQEKTYAAGRIPGGFFKREGRPSEKEILTCRLIDRPLRPLFPDGFFNEVQVIATVLSINPEVDSDVPAMIGASAAVTLAGLPFEGPIGATRVGYIDGQYILNPTKTELETSKLNLVVAGTEQAVLMVESEANELSEDVMLGAVVFGHEQMQVAIRAINELADEGGKDDWDWEAAKPDAALVDKIKALAENDLNEAYRMKSKSARSQRLDEINARVREACVENVDAPADSNVVQGILSGIEAGIVRGQILSGEARIDGRNTRTVRPISIRPTLLPRVHGSVLFTRGETQAIVTATLGTGQDEQIIDALQGEYTCTTTTSRRTRPVRRAASARRSAARSATGGSPSARSSRCCRARKSSATRCASFRRSPSRTARPRWRASAAAASR